MVDVRFERGRFETSSAQFAAYDDLAAHVHFRLIRCDKRIEAALCGNNVAIAFQTAGRENVLGDHLAPDLWHGAITDDEVATAVTSPRTTIAPRWFPKIRSPSALKEVSTVSCPRTPFWEGVGHETFLVRHYVPPVGA